MKRQLVIGITFLLIGILLEVLLTVILPITRSALYDSLASRSASIYYFSGILFLNVISLEGLQSLKGYIVLRVSLMTRQIKTHAVHQLEHLKESPITNIAQRIQEDIKLSYFNRITAYTEYVISGLILVYLLIVNLHYPSLLIAALVYAVISVGVAYLFNGRLKQAEVIVQNTEADLRNELRVLGISSFQDAQHANIKAGKIRLGFALFTKTQMSILTVLPFVLLAPLLLEHTISFQEIMERSTTFGLIVVNAAILVSMYPIMIQGKASEQRVSDLEKQ